MSLDQAAVYSEEAGCFVNGKLQRLAEIIKDYDSHLDLVWVPPNLRTSVDSHPYGIKASHPWSSPYIVFYFSENADPEKILAKIFLGDQKNHDVIATLDAENAAAEAFKLKQRSDELDDLNDQLHFLATSRSKNTVNWGRDKITGKAIRLDSNRRRIE